MLNRVLAMRRGVSAIVASLFVFMMGATALTPEPANSKTLNPIVVLETSKGNITIELYPDKAPISVENFLSYVNKKFFDGLVFHRVMDDFMIQGGGFTKDMVKKSGGPEIKNEAHNGLKNDHYTVAMARTNVVDSATSQFFINLKDNSFLNFKDKSTRGYGYAVFGMVIEGMDVVDAIGKVKTVSKGGYNDVPATPVIIKSAYETEPRAASTKTAPKAKE